MVEPASDSAGKPTRKPRSKSKPKRKNRPMRPREPGMKLDGTPRKPYRPPAGPRGKFNKDGSLRKKTGPKPAEIPVPMPITKQLPKVIVADGMDELAALEKQLEIYERKEYGIIRKLEEYEKANGAEFFRPYPYQQKLIDLLWEGKKTLFLQGSNQIGKTLLMCVLIDSFCCGKQRWDGRDSVFGGRPTKGRVVCHDWEYHAREVLIPKMKQTLTYADYETLKNNQGVEAFWKHKKTGSQFTLLTHSQDTMSHESDTCDWVMCDEPLPRDKFTANVRALIASRGIFCMFATAIREPWIYRELVQNPKPELKVGCVLRVEMSENKSLTAEEIQRFDASCTDRERAARVHGDFIQLEGLVYPEFDREKHIIKPFEVPVTWPVVIYIDFHPVLPHAISFYTIDERGIKYQVHELWHKGNNDEVVDSILRYRKEHSANIKFVYIDPLSKGDDKYMKKRVGEIDDTYTELKKKLNPYGILLGVAEGKNKKMDGVLNVRKMLKGIHGLPGFYITDTCVRTIQEFYEWSSDEEGRLSDENDHYMENLYRFSLNSLKFKYGEERVRAKPRLVAGIV